VNIREEISLATADCEREKKLVIGDESKYRDASARDAVTHLGSKLKSAWNPVTHKRHKKETLLTIC
jgi:hypothetical protein